MTRFLWIPLVAGAVYAWDHSDVGVGWAALLVGLILVLLGVRAQGYLGRRIWLLASSPLLALAFLEFGLHWMAPPTIVDQEPDIVQKDDDLGYRLRPSSGGWHSRRIGSEPIFGAKSTIGADGWRVVVGAGSTDESTASASPQRTIPERTVDVLGCSFAFGYGLADEESLASAIQSRLGPTTLVRPFAVRGWGPHQLLASLQSGYIAPRSDTPTEWSLYWAIPDHVQRVAGKRRWDRRGPRFEVVDGVVERMGNFGDAGPGPTLFTLFTGGAIARKMEHRSALARRLLKGESSLLDATDEDLERWAAVVGEIRLELDRWVPAPRFLVLLDLAGKAAPPMATRLAAMGIEVVDLDGCLSGLNLEGDDGRLHPRDRHPNAASIQQVAERVVARISSDH